MKNKTFFISLAVIIVVFCVLFFFSCNKGNNKPSVSDINSAVSSLNTPFDAKATINLNGIEFTADVNKTNIGSATITITKPETVNGMQFQYDGEDIKITYKGISVNLDDDSKIVSSSMPLIIKALNAAAQKNGITVENKTGQLLLSGKSEDKNFIITMDKETGTVANISFPDIDMECRFENFLKK